MYNADTQQETTRPAEERCIYKHLIRKVSVWEPPRRDTGGLYKRVICGKGIGGTLRRMSLTEMTSGSNKNGPHILPSNNGGTIPLLQSQLIES